MPPVPGTISTVETAFSLSSRIRAARPTAFGKALQGTQYSIRMRWPSPIGERGYLRALPMGRASSRRARARTRAPAPLSMLDLAREHGRRRPPALDLVVVEVDS